MVTSMLSLSLAACTYWQAGSPNPAEFISEKQPEKVRVTRADGSKFELRHPTILGDSLVGTVGGGLVPEDILRSLATMSDVQRVEVKKTSVGKTVALVGVGVAAVAITAVMMDCGPEDGNAKPGCH